MNKKIEKRRMVLGEMMKVNGKTYEVIRLLGKGKGGYSWLVTDGEREYTLKQYHHEPCDFYHFRNKMDDEIKGYERLKGIGIPVPELYDVDLEQEYLLKEYVQGDTVDRLIWLDKMEQGYSDQLKAMCERLYSANADIDYFPSNFVVRDGKLIYIDYDCCDYAEDWDFEHWGVRYWSKTPEFMKYVEEEPERFS